MSSSQQGQALENRASGRRLSASALPIVVLLLELTTAAMALWSHGYNLRSLPMGFYVDETSISYNAYSIASTGRDEYGVAFPLYTKAIGDYKNPFYIYLSALLIRIFGYSFYMVRLPSVLCWIVGTLLLFMLGRRLWPQPELRLYLLASLAFTPSLFCLSRIAFEVISLYPLLALFLFAVQRGFEAEQRTLLWAAIAGLAIGLSTYAYTTFRLLAPLHCLLVLVCYARRQYLKRLISFAASAFVTVIPFGIYFYLHPDHITSRYQRVGYVLQPMSAWEKAKIFLDHYRSFFSPDYLWLHGDPNTRHHIGFGGELLIPTLLGAALALIAVLASRRVRSFRFNRLLLGGLILSPLAAALADDPRHSLRAFSLPIFAVPLSVTGFYHARRFVPRALLALPAVAALVHGGLYVREYFGPYVSTSIQAFEFYGQRQAIEKALRNKAARIVLDSSRGSRHADLHANFYTALLKPRWGDRLAPLVPGRLRDVHPGEYFVFEDRKGNYPDLRVDLPENTLYLAAPYGRNIVAPKKRAKR